MTTPTEQLLKLYHQALQKQESTLSSSQMQFVDDIIDHAEIHKAVLTALITSLLKKSITPKQDVRYHKVELRNGYSGRTFDSHYVTPFLQKYFPRYAMAESGWLTRSIEQPHPFTRDFAGKIRNEKVKQAFLEILHDVEEKGANPIFYLLAIFMRLIDFQRTQNLPINRVLVQGITVNHIISALESHFFTNYKQSGASRLPVLALHAVYQHLMTLPRYERKTLSPLKKHTTADTKSKSIGDIEVINADGTFFEAIEVKHGKPITPELISLTYSTKISQYSIQRYYLLSTAKPDVVNPEGVFEKVEKIRSEHGCEVIANGVVASLKYYLRLIDNVDEFVQTHTTTLIADFEAGTDIKRAHIEQWERLLNPL